MPLLSLLRRTSDYIASHAAERRAPADAECVDCGKGEPEIGLAKCSVCEAWRCTEDYSMHRAPDGYYLPPTRRAWWLRLVRRG